VTEADAEVEPALGQPLQRRRRSGERERLVLGVDENRGSEAKTRGNARRECERVEGCGAPSVVPDAVLGRPDRVEAEAFGECSVLGEGPIVGTRLRGCGAIERIVQSPRPSRSSIAGVSASSSILVPILPNGWWKSQGLVHRPCHRSWPKSSRAN
jgi:hypothetical protein